jgi:hypothetical protein
MNADTNPAMPAQLHEGDVLVYMQGRLLVVDHLVPEAFTVDLVELHEADAAGFRENIDPSQLHGPSD